MSLLPYSFKTDFICSHCQSTEPFLLKPPLVITCSSCKQMFSVDEALQVESLKDIYMPPKEFSLISIGQTGSFNGKGFKVCGRIRLLTSTSVSNEWFIVFEDGSASWLIENCFEYFLFSNEVSSFNPELIKDHVPGHEIKVDNKKFIITDFSKKNSMRVQGQIPADAYNRHDFFIIDLLSSDFQLASVVMYNKSEAEITLGQKIKFQDLNIQDALIAQEWLANHE
jgi:hypothetical protein